MNFLSSLEPRVSSPPLGFASFFLITGRVNGEQFSVDWEVIRNFTNFAPLRSAVGSENSHHPLDQYQMQHKSWRGNPRFSALYAADIFSPNFLVGPLDILSPVLIKRFVIHLVYDSKYILIDFKAPLIGHTLYDNISRNLLCKLDMKVIYAANLKRFFIHFTGIYVYIILHIGGPYSFRWGSAFCYYWSTCSVSSFYLCYDKLKNAQRRNVFNSVLECDVLTAHCQHPSGNEMDR